MVAIALTRVALGAALLASMVASGCGSDTAETYDELDGQPIAFDDGTLTGTFAMEAPHKGRDNTLHMELFDSSEEPVEGATVTITPWMPAHGHGSEEATASEVEAGVYEADLYFFMTGVWTLTVMVSAEDTDSSVVLTVVVR